MIVTFAMQAENESFPVFPRAELMVASIRKYIPGAHIVQLTNETFPALVGADEVLRVPYGGDFIEWAFRAFIGLLERGEPVLQIATDVLINGDIISTFAHEFDNASCRYPLQDRADGAFCGDVNFVKPSGLQFWREVYNFYMKSPSIVNTWEGGQTAFLEVAKNSSHKILALPYEEYCYTPEDFDEDVSKARIIHFRGNRKGMMGYYAKDIMVPFKAKVVGNVSDEVLEANCRYAMTLQAEMLAAQYIAPKPNKLLIVGGGPSLKECLGEIALAQKGGASIWALNNAFSYLLAHGIEADAQLLMDARAENEDFVPEKTKANLLYSTQCHRSVLEKGIRMGRVILWNPSIAPILDILNEHKKIGAVVAGGSSVGLKALGLAHLFGFKEVHLYGYDSSYRAGENHAYSQSLNSKENTLEITIGKRKFKSAYWMVVQTEEFRESLPNFIKLGMEISVHGDGLLPYAAQLMS